MRRVALSMLLIALSACKGEVILGEDEIIVDIYDHERSSLETPRFGQFWNGVFEYLAKLEKATYGREIKYYANNMPVNACTAELNCELLTERFGVEIRLASNGRHGYFNHDSDSASEVEADFGESLSKFGYRLDSVSMDSESITTQDVFINADTGEELNLSDHPILSRVWTAIYGDRVGGTSSPIASCPIQYFVYETHRWDSPNYCSYSPMGRPGGWPDWDHYEK